MTCELCGKAEAIKIRGCPFSYCDQCFAYMGVARVRRIPRWRSWVSSLWLFVRIVWRVDQSESRMSVRTAWAVCESLRVREFPG
jgi:ribosome-binding protein aMBF1 (putative translation factor)